MTHTPGPWNYRKNNQQEIDERWSVYWGNEPYLSREVASVSAPVDSFDFNEPKANAVLIAAAPDLLSALKSAHRELILYSHVDPRVLAAVEAAIDRAEGKSNA